MPNYSGMLTVLKNDLDRFIAERDALQQKIDRITAAIDAMEILAIQDSDAPILEPPAMTADEEKGFTDRVRDVLQLNPLRPLTAVEIRDVLLKANPDADPRIALIHIHNTLKRLERQIEVREVQRADGKAAYKWRPRWARLAGAIVGEGTGLSGRMETAWLSELKSASLPVTP